ncbi:hypothetical protein [Photobacterium leiognathi]|uniref:hypothetical protein n=1 Tax=Photobacterium leiognathi TaxID=553611 RepID=UPI002735062C|nr:hypothetical protein [Photobacterium leiognathi]
MEKEWYYLLAITISSSSAIVSVIAAFNTFKFSKAAKEASEAKFELDRSKYKPFFVSKLDYLKYNELERRYEGQFVLENAGEVTQRIDRISVGGSAELVPTGSFIISTPELLDERVLIESGKSISVEFKIHTWDVRISKANIEVRLNTSNSYLPNENLLLKCGEETKPV